MATALRVSVAKVLGNWLTNSTPTTILPPALRRSQHTPNRLPWEIRQAIDRWILVRNSNFGVGD